MPWGPCWHKPHISGNQRTGDGRLQYVKLIGGGLLWPEKSIASMRIVFWMTRRGGFMLYGQCSLAITAEGGKQILLLPCHFELCVLLRRWFCMRTSLSAHVHTWPEFILISRCYILTMLLSDQHLPCMLMASFCNPRVRHLAALMLLPDQQLQCMLMSPFYDPRV